MVCAPRSLDLHVQCHWTCMCSVILSEASLRAKSKDPQLVASSAWVADPSQAQDDIQPLSDPKLTRRCTTDIRAIHCGRRALFELVRQRSERRQLREPH